METTIEQLEQQYPDSAERLKQLPAHVVEHVGETALKLTHTDMHPAETVKDSYGREFQRIDFDNVITDPEYDISELDAQTVEAAHAGREKLAKVLQTSSELLETAHQGLLEKGSVFGSVEVETEDARTERESEERETIYKAALDIAIESAKKAKAEGREDEETKFLESLVLLSYMRPREDRVLLRRVVREGMAEGLVKAGKESAKLFAGDRYNDGVANRLRSASQLLEFATGKKLDSGFNEIGELKLTSSRGAVDIQDIQDLLAVATMPGSKVSLKDVFILDEGSTPVLNIKKRVELFPGEDMNSILWGLTEIEKSEDLSEVLLYSDPVCAYDTAKRLGIETWRVQWLFGHSVEDSQLIDINPDQVNGMVELKKSFPEYFEQIKDGLWRRYLEEHTTYDPIVIIDGLKSLRETGDAEPILFEGLCRTNDVLKYVEVSKEIFHQLRNANIDPSKLGELIEKGDLKDIYKFITNCMQGEANISKHVERLITHAQIIDTYLQAYSEIRYPLSSLKDAVTNPELADLPEIEKRLQRLGLPPEVANSMFASWASYDAYMANFYNDETGFGPPAEIPDQATLTRIAKDQAKALQGQIEAIEAYAATYGTDSMNQIISNFGIYNFNKHDIKQLYEQNERWTNGESARTVVVNSRFDWNSFTGFDPVFKEAEGEGVFVFEASSGTEIAKIAVQIGKRERSLGREPDVRRFIIHAHGNPEKMRMGVNGEVISTEDYLKVARAREKLASAQINDYKKHLGQNFEVVLQSCSTAGEAIGKNIAQTISQQHDVKVTASRVTINSLTILSDGTVEFTSREDLNEPKVIYDT